MNTEEGSHEEMRLEMSVDDPNGNVNPEYLKWEQRKKTLENFIKIIRTKLEAFIWICAAGFSVWYTSFFQHLICNSDVNKIFLYPAIVCLTLQIGLIIYSSAILPFVLRVRESFENRYPRAAYFGGVNTFFGFMTLGIAVWPIWGFWSFPLLFLIGIGMLMIGHFLPEGCIGSMIVGSFFVFAFIFLGIFGRENVCAKHGKDEKLKIHVTQRIAGNAFFIIAQRIFFLAITKLQIILY